ncbi:MAG: RES family NAD+ phosphorylase [Cyclobacteriaceae bacterium]|jgi:RES domain-containing protein|nr:RES family NAD+ phosphorylase [Cytophagales bacterium]MCZ8329497.1 RES family NAD+ phosphorylase [Cyclobacteriaceae bacterium]
MQVYRLSRKKFASTLSGKGAAIKGARWNSIGVELIYTAENRSLAMAEVAVHLTLATLPSDFVMIGIFIPDSVPITTLREEDLPPDWGQFPHAVSTQLIGDKFVRDNEYLIMKVPSVVTKGDHNYLINPHHKDFFKVSVKAIDTFPFDQRLLK